MFAEKSVYEPATEDEGLRVLVMRQWPRGVSTGRVDVWLKELGPPPALLRDLAERRISWLAFSAAYEQQLTDSPATVEAVATLRDLERRSGTVTLFCHERQPPCHRFLLLDWLARRE
ncbi:MAG: MarR family transcriptional regulator [Chloroflexi bacterium]|jgi:uncharacterized protein YeaO (DUF488 family)|nr:MarR family transcriptional regulator [Chloroflexota bacterium]MDB5075953.1 MarR family transcriptional regulator [Chloroflexota bacterium]